MIGTDTKKTRYWRELRHLKRGKNHKTNEIYTQQDIQQAERDDTEAEYFQPNKKPRTEDKQ
eukprot:887944-Heterocapsa_arctica.AAC.1